MVTLANGDAFRGALVERVQGDHVTIVLATGETRRFAWSEIRSSDPVAPSHASAAPPDPPRENVTSEPQPPRGQLRRKAGYITLGAGGGVFALGLVATLLAESKRSDLSPCAPACSRSSVDNARTADVVEPLGIVAMVMGGAAVITGAVLVLTAPSPSQTVAVYLAPGSGGIAGRF